MKSIRSKLFITYAALLLLTVILLGAGMTLFVRSFYLGTIRERLEEEARVAGELLKPHLIDYSSDANLVSTDKFVNLLGEKTSARITLVAPDGVVVGDSAQDVLLMDNHLYRPEFQSAKDDLAGSSIRFSDTVNESMLYTAVYLVEDAQHVGFLRLALPLSQLNKAIARIQYGLVAGLLLVLGLTLGISLKLSYSLTKPLGQISDVAERISEGELESRIYLHNNDEIGALADAVNKMAESLQQQVREVLTNKEQLEVILSTMVEGVIMFNEECRAVMVNPAAESMLGLQKNGWIGRHDLEIIRNADLNDKIVKVSRDKVLLEHEITTMFPEAKTLSISLVPVQLKSLNKTGVLAVFHDITRLRHLEEMRADFAANVSHELRTPLTAISGFAETLLDGAYNNPESALRFSNIIHKEAVRLNRLIEDLLKLSQIEKGKIAIAKEAVDIKELMNEVVAILGDRLANYEITIDIPIDVPQISGDRGLLTQALYNLVDNAVKYSPQQGVIKLSARGEGDFVRLAVSDSGIGIPEEDRVRIFERFYRIERARSRRFGGTGLGLAIVKHIVEAHKGHIELDSEEGKGTKVSLLLPLV